MEDDVARCARAFRVIEQIYSSSVSFEKVPPGPFGASLALKLDLGQLRPDIVETRGNRNKCGAEVIQFRVDVSLLVPSKLNEHSDGAFSPAGHQRFFFGGVRLFVSFTVVAGCFVA